MSTREPGGTLDAPERGSLPAVTAPPTPKASALLRWLPVAVLVAATIIHLPTLDQPLLERHNVPPDTDGIHRPDLHEEGIDPCTPSFRSWDRRGKSRSSSRCSRPVTSLVMNAGIAEDAAMRLTGLVSFVLDGESAVAVGPRDKSGPLGGDRSR